MSFVDTLSRPRDTSSPWAMVSSSLEVRSNRPTLSRVLNWKLLSAVISSLYPRLRSVDMALAASFSEVEPMVISVALGYLVGAPALASKTSSVNSSG